MNSSMRGGFLSDLLEKRVYLLVIMGFHMRISALLNGMDKIKECFRVFCKRPEQILTLHRNEGTWLHSPDTRSAGTLLNKGHLTKNIS